MYKCKYYNKHFETINEYISCLYRIEGGSCGGMLHILLDDDNIDDDDITFCLKECINHPEREESKIGKLICEEYLGLSMPERRLLENFSGKWYGCTDRCCKCYIETGVVNNE